MDQSVRKPAQFTETEVLRQQVSSPDGKPPGNRQNCAQTCTACKDAYRASLEWIYQSI